MRRILFYWALVCFACGGNSTSPSSTLSASFTGVYTGTYQIVTCVDGSFTGFCTTAGFAPGARLPISLSAAQNQNVVTGTLMLGIFGGTFQGTAAGTGLTGTAALNAQPLAGLSVTTNVTAWSTTLIGNSMTGNFSVSFALPGFTQPSTVNASIVSLTR